MDISVVHDSACHREYDAEGRAVSFCPQGQSTLSMAECIGGENLSGSGWHPGGTVPSLDRGLQISFYEFKWQL